MSSVLHYKSLKIAINKTPLDIDGGDIDVLNVLLIFY